jgi:serine/threonine-protein kinase
VHRDVKPSNIIITPSGRAKLVDLGLARKENRDDPAADLTVAGTTLGTFDYISPEQARDPRTADVRSDIYSLGCTLYHMLAGEPPFPQGTVLQKLLQHQGDEAPDPAARNHLVPENLSAVVRRMMAKDPRRRYQTPEQLVRDLLLVAGSMGLRSVSPEGVVWLASHAPQSTFWERHLAWMSTAALLLVIVGYMEFGGMRDLTRDRGEAGSSRATSAKRGQTQNAIAGGRSERRTSSERTTGRSFEGGQSAADTLEAGDQDRTESPAIGTEADSDDQEAPGRVLKPIPLVEAASAKGEPGFAVGPESVAQGTANGGASPGQGASTVPPARPTVAQGTIPDEPDDVNQSGGRTERPTAPSQGASSERPTASESAVAPADDRRYSTLEAACAAVRNDGAVIELRFDGRRIETGVRVSRRVTIRPGKGFQPTIEFRPQQPTADGYQVRAISVPTGALDVIGIDLALAVDETVPADQWALFSLERPESLRLQGVSLTLLNSRRRPAAIVEIRSSPGAMMPDMPVAGMPQRPPLEIEIDSSLVRGDGDLFVIRQVESARMAVKQSAIAVDGALLTSRGHSEQSPEDARLELRLEHVTAVTTASLVSFDSGTVPRKLLPLAVLASNCIFSNADQVPLISMSGNSPTHDFRPLLSWTGQNNFYDRYPITWSIVSLEATSRSDAWDAAAWRKYWTDSGEANPRFDGVVWKRRAWTTRAFAELVAADFALDSDAAGNGAVRGATDSTDAGASLSALPRVAPGPSHSSAGTRVRE